MNDLELLNNALNNTKTLLKNVYVLKLSSKKKEYDLKINFLEKDFFHLLGLHYLSDIDEFRVGGKLRNSRINYKDIVAKTKLRMKIINSVFFKKIRSRIEAFNSLSDAVQNSELNSKYFKYLKSSSVKEYTCIRFDFLIQYLYSERIFYYFILGRGNGFYFMDSLFENETVDYSKGHTVLKFISCSLALLN